MAFLITRALVIHYLTTAFSCSSSRQSAKITTTSGPQMLLGEQVTERSVKTAPFRLVTFTPASISKISHKIHPFYKTESKSHIYIYKVSDNPKDPNGTFSPFGAWSYEVCVCVCVCVWGGGGRVDTSLYWVTHTGTEERERERRVHTPSGRRNSVWKREGLSGRTAGCCEGPWLGGPQPV